VALSSLSRASPRLRGLEWTMTTEPHAVLALTLPDQYFGDDDAYCLAAGTHIAKTLGQHLEAHGHVIPDWVRGGCKEDAWVHFESESNGVRYEYAIVFFPREDHSSWMAIQYGLRMPFWKRLFGRKPKLTAKDPIHRVLAAFGQTHERSELLTEKQFAVEY
jgi:hypothetical protein